MTLYTSCEATGAQAEYIRDGLDYEQWLRNTKRMLVEGNSNGVNIMMTINSLCLFSITDFLDEVYKLKELTQSQNTNSKFKLIAFSKFSKSISTT